MTPPPLKLTDSELDAVFRAAAPISPDLREAFLQDVANRLSNCSVVGPGVVHRVCSEAQRRFFDPPDLANGSWGKYR